MKGFFNASKQGLVSGLNIQDINMKGRTIEYGVLMKRAETNDRPRIFISEIRTSIPNLDQYGLGLQGTLQNIEMELHSIVKKGRDYYANVFVNVNGIITTDIAGVKIYDLVHDKMTSKTLAPLFETVNSHISKQKQNKADDKKRIKELEEQMEVKDFKLQKAVEEKKQWQDKYNDECGKRMDDQMKFTDDMDAMQRKYEGQLVVQKRKEEMEKANWATVGKLVDLYGYTFAEATKEVFGISF